MHEIRHKNIVIHSNATRTNPVDQFGAARTLVVWAHGSHDEESADNLATVPAFTTLYYRTHLGTVSILTECPNFIRGHGNEIALLGSLEKVAGGVKDLNYNLIAEAQPFAIPSADAVYDYATVQAGQRARLSDLWEALNSNGFLCYKKVLGWFCRVPKNYEWAPNVLENDDGSKRSFVSAEGRMRGIAKAVVEYQDAPKEFKRCATCEIFNSQRDACAKVDGANNPNGYCTIWMARRN